VHAAGVDAVGTGRLGETRRLARDGTTPPAMARSGRARRGRLGSNFSRIDTIEARQSR